jgi:hypothetical protein
VSGRDTDCHCYSRLACLPNFEDIRGEAALQLHGGVRAVTNVLIEVDRKCVLDVG